MSHHLVEIHDVQTTDEDSGDDNLHLSTSRHDHPRFRASDEQDGEVHVSLARARRLVQTKQRACLFIYQNDHPSNACHRIRRFIS